MNCEIFSTHTSLPKILNRKFLPEITTKKSEPTFDVWESMGLDQYLRKDVVEKRKASGKLMTEIYKDLIPSINKSEMPFWIIPKI